MSRGDQRRSLSTFIPAARTLEQPDEVGALRDLCLHQWLTRLHRLQSPGKQLDAFAMTIQKSV